MHFGYPPAKIPESPRFRKMEAELWLTGGSGGIMRCRIREIPRENGENNKAHMQDSAISP